ncbi:MAG TPA: hypothetical protein VFY17_10645 [Pilimelia sp.]|nr:hypothetical protein [Pilimelia sp.]
MTRALEAAAAALDAGAALLGDAAGDAVDFGGDAPGLPGELGRGLHARWVAALEARRREVREVCEELTALHAAVAEAAAAYTDTDAAVTARWGGGWSAAGGDRPYDGAPPGYLGGAAGAGGGPTGGWGDGGP